jgi:hypothetical protein
METKDSGSVPRNLLSELLANDIKLGLLLVAVARFARRIGNASEAELVFGRIETLYSDVKRTVEQEFKSEEKPSLFDDLQNLRGAIDGLSRPEPGQAADKDFTDVKYKKHGAEA